MNYTTTAAEGEGGLPLRRHSRVDFLQDLGHLLFDYPLDSSLLSIFVKIVTPDLLNKILLNLVINTDIIKKSPTKRTVNDLVKLYMTMAISIRIQELQDRPLRNRQNSRPLRSSIKEAHDRFLSRNLGFNIGGKGFMIL